MVQILDAVPDTDQPYLVMEYLEGADLKAIMGALRDLGRPFPRQAAFEIIGAIASALDAAGIPNRTVTRRGNTSAPTDDPLRGMRSARSADELHAFAVDLLWPDGNDDSDE